MNEQETLVYLKMLYMNLAVSNPNIERILKDIKSKIEEVKNGNNRTN